MSAAATVGAVRLRDTERSLPVHPHSITASDEQRFWGTLRYKRPDGKWVVASMVEDS